MHFKEEFTVEVINPAGFDALEFEYDDVHQVSVSTRAVTPEELISGCTNSDAICVASGFFNPSEEVMAMFRSLSACRLPVGSNLQDPNVAQDGTIKDSGAVSLDALPENFRCFARAVADELYSFADRTLRILRWRRGVTGNYNPIKYHRSGAWSEDGQLWHKMPHGFHLHIEFVSSCNKISEEIKADVMGLMKEGESEPLGHELFQEAWALRNANPRSALLLGVAAVEIRLKELIGETVPDARWLAMNAPSPPVVQMLTEYLPKLPVKTDLEGKVLPPPAAIVEILKKGILARNQVTHGRKSLVKRDELTALLLAARDTLYLLDVYSGKKWAWENIGFETRKALVEIAKKKA